MVEGGEAAALVCSSTSRPSDRAGAKAVSESIAATAMTGSLMMQGGGTVVPSNVAAM